MPTRALAPDQGANTAVAVGRDSPASAARIAGLSLLRPRGLAFDVALALGPVAAWSLAGMLGSRPLEGAAHLAIILLLIAAPRVGYLALIPLLPFSHPAPFPPHGPIVGEAVAIVVSAALWATRGSLSISPAARPAVWLACVLLVMTVFQTLLGVRVLGGSLDLGVLSQLDQVAVILIVFIGGVLFLDLDHILPALLAYFASLIVVSGVAVIYFLRPGVVGRLGLDWMISADAVAYRASGVIPNPNFLGLYLAMGLACLAVGLTWYLIKGRTIPVLAGAAVASLASAALLFTLSRAAIGALVAGIIVALARLSGRAALVMAGAVIVAALLVYPLFLDLRLGQTFGAAGPRGEAAQAASDDLRSGQARAAVDAFLDAPLLGHGFGTFQVLSPTYSGQDTLTSAHNAFLKLAAEQGVVGLGLFIGLLASIAIPLWRAPLGPWTAGLAALGTLVLFSLTGDSLSSAQALAPGAALLAALLVAGIARHDPLGVWPRADAGGSAAPA